MVRACAALTGRVETAEAAAKDDHVLEACKHDIQTATDDKTALINQVCQSRTSYETRQPPMLLSNGDVMSFDTFHALDCHARVLERVAKKMNYPCREFSRVKCVPTEAGKMTHHVGHPGVVISLLAKTLQPSPETQDPELRILARAQY